MKVMKDWWNHFAERHPSLSQWVREGGLFIIVSNAITVFKYVLLTFLPGAFAFLGSRDFGFPGIDLTLFGIKFKWYIIGYGAEQGGAAYFTAYMIAMLIGEMINFFVQRSWVFRSKGEYPAPGHVVSSGVLCGDLHRELHQLRLGCGSRSLCSAVAVQYRNHSPERRRLHGGILHREQNCFQQ